MTRYVGKRYLIKHCGNWDSTKETEYESMSAVYYAGDSYISIQAVPKGIELQDTRFWRKTCDFNEQLNLLQESINTVNSTIGNYENTFNSYDTKIEKVVNDSKTLETKVNEKIENVGKNFKTSFNNFFNTITKDSKIILIGDSITAGVNGSGYSPTGKVIYGTYKQNESGFCYGNLLKEKLINTYNCVCENRAISGIRTTHIVENIDSLISDATHVYCMIGTNNRSSDFDRIVSDLNYIIDYCKQKEIQIIFALPIPTLYNGVTSSHKIEEVAQIESTLFKKLNIPYIDMYNEFYKMINNLNVSIDEVLTDRLHPNDFGYKIMYQILSEQLNLQDEIEYYKPIITRYTNTNNLNYLFVNSSIGNDNYPATSNQPIKTLKEAFRRIPAILTMSYAIVLQSDITLNERLVLNSTVQGGYSVNIYSENTNDLKTINGSIAFGGGSIYLHDLIINGNIDAYMCYTDIHNVTFLEPSPANFSFNAQYSSVYLSNNTFTNTQRYSIKCLYYCDCYFYNNTFLNNSYGYSLSGGCKVTFPNGFMYTKDNKNNFDLACITIRGFTECIKYDNCNILRHDYYTYKLEGETITLSNNATLCETSITGSNIFIPIVGSTNYFELQSNGKIVFHTKNTTDSVNINATSSFTIF